jgi:hypothetical protein
MRSFSTQYFYLVAKDISHKQFYDKIRMLRHTKPKPNRGKSCQNGIDANPAQLKPE